MKIIYFLSNVTFPAFRSEFFHQFHLKIPIKINFNIFLEPDRSNYWILNTDYTGFSIIVSCRPTEENKSIEAYWLLSRDQTISEEGRRIADAVVDSKLDKNRIRKTVQDPEK